MTGNPGTPTPTTARRLLTPLDLGPYRLANRMVMAPMTRSRAGRGGVPTEPRPHALATPHPAAT